MAIEYENKREECEEEINQLRKECFGCTKYEPQTRSVIGFELEDESMNLDTTEVGDAGNSRKKRRCMFSF